MSSLMGGYFRLFAVSAVVMGISYTTSKERLFEPLRRRCGGKETLLGYLVECPFCTSFWVAFVLVPLTGAYYLRTPWPLGFAKSVIDWFLSSMLVVVIAAFLRVGFFFIDETQGLIRRRQRREEVEREVLEREALDREEPRGGGAERRAAERGEPRVH